MSIFHTLKARFSKEGHIYKDLLFWQELSNAFPEIPWFKDVVKCTRMKYILGGSHFSETEYYKRKYGYIVFQDKKVIIPEEKDIRLMKSECIDIVLPYYCKEKYNFDSMDKYFEEGPYELNEHVEVKNGDIVFDLGANMGLFSAMISDRAKKIYAFEPSSIIQQKYTNVMSSLYPNLEVCPYAVSDHAGEMTFLYNINNIGASHVSSGYTNDKCIEEKVPVISLDQYVKENKIEKVDFIKADIEGAERDMIKGASNILKTFSPKLSLCTYHLPDDKEVLESLILEANPNYIIEHKYKKLYAYVPQLT